MSIHTTNGVRVVAVAACTGLVFASAGFGAAYAYSIGIQHGYVLAGLTILFAVALELVKPLAISSAFQAFASWHFGRCLALSILGLVAVVYSLTAELALTASSRSDLVAKRGLEGNTATTDKTKYDAAVEELKLIHPSRTAPEVEADIVRTRDINRIAKLKGEKARTERREKLQGIVSNYKPGMNKVADPGSASIQTYLSALGVSVELDTLAKWLNLVPVLALELGSALAVVLVNAMPRPEPPVTVLESLPSGCVTPTLNHVVQPEIRPSRLLAERSQATRDAVSRRIVNHLKDHGGSVAGSERSLARAVGASKPTLRRAIQAMAGAGVVALAASKQGTQITLLS